MLPRLPFELLYHVAIATVTKRLIYRSASTAIATNAKLHTPLLLSPRLRLKNATKSLYHFYEQEFPLQEAWIRRLKWASEDMIRQRKARITGKFAKRYLPNPDLWQMPCAQSVGERANSIIFTVWITDRPPL